MVNIIPHADGTKGQEFSTGVKGKRSSMKGRSASLCCARSLLGLKTINEFLLVLPAYIKHVRNKIKVLLLKLVHKNC